ncbi:hypothetical protein C7M84_011722 [Penaeus vannamei]|uniref:Uncharacterized protein n=1 Tax=Penaeus vannamei TaxID=6689 RepID=A0A3R7NY70_PENVA|nr:hypothetical protein C7M84_011722 [Penaeus vannamei]
MWRVLLVALPLAFNSFHADASEQETVNTEEQRYKYLLYQIHGMVQRLLHEKEKHFNQSLEALTQLVETACRSQQGKQTTGSMNLVNTERAIEEMANVFFARVSATSMNIFDDIQAKLTVMATDIMGEITTQLLGKASVQDLAELQSQVSTLPTSEGLSDLQKDLLPVASSATEGLKQAVSTLASEVDTSMENVATSDQIAEIQEEIDSVTLCNQRNDFDQVLTLLSTAEEDLGDLAETLQSSVAEQKAACQGEAERQESTAAQQQLLESLRAAVDGNANGIRGVASAVRVLGDEGEGEVGLGYPPSHPPTTLNSSSASLSVVRDVFRSVVLFQLASAGLGVDVCQAAVRLGKCEQLSVAVHCCRSCSAAGRIPVMGAHRFVNASRTLSRVSAAKLMRP